MPSLPQLILKMKVCGFEKGKHMGMQAYSNFVADFMIGLHVIARGVLGVFVNVALPE